MGGSYPLVVLIEAKPLLQIGMIEEKPPLTVAIFKGTITLRRIVVTGSLYCKSLPIETHELHCHDTVFPHTFIQWAVGKCLQL